MYPKHIESSHTYEDAIAGDQLQIERQCGGGHPTVGLMDLLPKGVAGATGQGPQLGATVDETLVGLHDIEIGERSRRLAQSKVSPAGPQGPIRSSTADTNDTTLVRSPIKALAASERVVGRGSSAQLSASVSTTTCVARRRAITLQR